MCKEGTNSDDSEFKRVEIVAVLKGTICKRCYECNSRVFYLRSIPRTVYAFVGLSDDKRCWLLVVNRFKKLDFSLLKFQSVSSFRLYIGTLEQLSRIVTPSEFLALLPSDGCLGFFLPYLQRCYSRCASDSVSERLVTGTRQLMT